MLEYDTFCADGHALDAAVAPSVRALRVKIVCRAPTRFTLLPSSESSRPPKLIDFGTAKLVGRSPGSSEATIGAKNKWKEFVGTPEYMSPEAIDNKDTDYRADLWSLGCFLVQMVAGVPPFKGGSDYLTFK